MDPPPQKNSFIWVCHSGHLGGKDRFQNFLAPYSLFYFIDAAKVKFVLGCRVAQTCLQMIHPFSLTIVKKKWEVKSVPKSISLGKTTGLFIMTYYIW